MNGEQDDEDDGFLVRFLFLNMEINCILMHVWPKPIPLSTMMALLQVSLHAVRKA